MHGTDGHMVVFGQYGKQATIWPEVACNNSYIILMYWTISGR